MSNIKKPYLIEGLDCSGKKTVAKLVKKRIEKEINIPVKLVIGAFVKSPIKTLERIVSNPTKLSKKKAITSFLKKIIYTIAPVIDFYFYKPVDTYLTIKISSHLRAKAKSIIDNDILMIELFKKFRKKSVNYYGATFLTTPFETRLLRHQIDVNLGKTNKEEAKRFYNYDKQLFQKWDIVLENLIKQEIKTVIVIKSNETSIEDIADKILKHIKSLYDI